MNAKHTPGPYRIGARCGHLMTEITSEDGSRCLATVWTHTFKYLRSGSPTLPNPEGQANLALFVAAPETAAERDTLAAVLHDANELHSEVCDERDEFKAANAALVGACKAALSYLEDYVVEYGCRERDLYHTIEAAITAAKGEV